MIALAVFVLAAQAAGPLDYFHFETLAGRPLDPDARNPDRPVEVDIDSGIAVTVDEDGSMEFVARAQGAIPAGDPLDAQIELARKAVDSAIVAQTHLALVRSLERRLASTPSAAYELRIELERENNRFADAGIPALMGVRDLARGGGKPEDRLLLDAVEAALLDDDYAAVGRAVDARLAALDAQLRARVDAAPRVEVTMRAFLVAEAGTRELCLDGYGSCSEGVPSLFPRFQIGLDERVEAELRAAEHLETTVEQAQSGQIKANLELARDDLRRELQRLDEAIRLDVLKKSLDQLRDDLRLRPDMADPALLEALTRLLRAVEAFEALQVPAEGSDADKLVELLRLLGELQDSVEQASQALLELDQSLERFETILTEAVQRFGGNVAQGTRNALEDTRRALAGSQGIAATRATLDELQRALGLLRDTTEGVVELGATARVLARNQPLDTALDLRTAGERHPGDTVVVTLRIAPEGRDEAALFTRSRSFRVETRGVYVHARGSLWFVEPEGELEGVLAYGPTVAVGLLAHWGAPGATWWNRFLDPGVGLGLSFLDFDPERDLDLGATLTATLFHDLLWAGYGVDLQADERFHFVGLNPLLLGSLLRASSGTAAADLRLNTPD